MPLTDEDKKKYRDLYIQTAKPYLKDLQKIATLKNEDAEALEVIHRAAHSLGSQSLMMEFNSLGLLSRAIEKIFKMTRDGDYKLNAETKEVLVKAIERMKESVDGIEKGGSELDLSANVEEIHLVSKITV